MVRFRLALLLAACLISLAAPAALVAERSPFAQGLWWDPARPGHGFEMFNVGTELQVFWYTYDASGQPIWYTAQGDMTKQSSLPLLRHRWRNGRKDGYDVVGQMTVTIVDQETARIDFSINGPSFDVGTWKVTPFRIAGASNEVDHSGDWFDPANGGFGLTVLEQGDAFGGALFTYDAEGKPTWLAGFERGTRKVGLFQYSGSCPGCAYKPPQAKLAGTVEYIFDGEGAMRLQPSLATPFAAGIDLAASRFVQLGRPASARPADRQLAKSGDPAALLAYLKAGMHNLGRRMNGGGADFSASPGPQPTTAFSATNLQEAGVDEADFLKSDGRFLYTFQHDSSGARRPTVRIAELAPGATALAPRSSLSLKGTDVATAGLYLTGNRLVAITGTQAATATGAVWSSNANWIQGTTQVEVFDTRDPVTPAAAWRVAIDGHNVASRRIGDTLYVVNRFVPYVPEFSYGSSSAGFAAREYNESKLAQATLATLLPQMRIDGGAAQPAVAVGDVYLPPLGSQKAYADIVLVVAIDLANPRVTGSLAIVGATEAVYVSPSNLYIPTARQDLRDGIGALRPVPAGALPMLDVHQVALGANGMTVAATGTVEGTLGSDLDRAIFRLSEAGGRLRIVTSSQVEMAWGSPDSRNLVTILAPSSQAPGTLKTVATLPNKARPARIGKPLEELYATRFVGDRLYAVTFPRQAAVQTAPTVDPLYVIDLANAADPQVKGELEVPGFSEYLHPLPGGLLLGFGRDASTTTGTALGLQLSLFDVADDGKPKILQRVSIGQRGSDSALLKSHHALGILPLASSTTGIAIPARVHDGPAVAGFGDGATYAWQESALMVYELQGRQLVQKSKIPFAAHTLGFSNAATDHAAQNGRPIVFANGAVAYAGNGYLWLRDAAGVTQGPF